MKLLLSSLLFFFVCCSTFAQWQNRFVFSRINKGSGLASDVVSGAAQDSDGYMWFATGNSLQRYDGTRFFTIHHVKGDSTSIPDALVLHVLFDTRGRLWLLMTGNTIGILNTRSFRFTPVKVNLPEDVRNNDFFRFKEERDGSLHILVGGYGMITYSEKNNEFSAAYNEVKLDNSKVALDLCYAGTGGNYWVATDQGMDLYSTQTHQFLPREGNQILTQLNKILKEDKGYGPSGTFYDSAGRFWTLTWSGRRGVPEIYHYDPKIKKLSSYSSSLVTSTTGYFDVQNILQQKDGTVWVYGNNVFARLNQKTNRFEDVRNESLLNHGVMVETIFQMYEDRDKNLWLCTSSGLYFFNPGKQFFVNFSNYRDDAKKYTNSSNAVIQTKDGTIYSTAWGAGIFVYDSSFNVIPNPIIPVAKANDGISVWDMTERKNGEVWMAMQGGSIRIYNQHTKKLTEYHLSVFENHTVRQVVEDSLGNMWMGTQSGLVVKCTEANWQDTTHAFQLLYRLKGHVVKMAVDSYGFVWICTDRFGVFKLNPADGKIVDRYSDRSPKNRRLNAAGASDILQYNDTTLLLASGNVDQINLRTGNITHGEVMKLNLVGSAINFIKDRLGFVWVGTYDGIYRFKPGEKMITYYDGSDGITDTRFLPNATAMLQNGALVLGTTTGLLVIDPSRLRLPAKAQPASISEFKVFGNGLNVDSLLNLKKISLPYSDNSLSVFLTTFNYNHEFVIKYMLEGLDKSWQISNSNAIQYSYLDHGHYTLKIKSMTASGFESEEKSLIIDISPPFWNSWGFYCLLILTGIGILYLIDRERMKRIRSNQQLRSEIGLSLANEVTTVLNNINLMSEMARRKADRDIDRSKELIEQISEKSNDMITALDDMLWSIDPLNDRMEKILQRMSEYADAMQKNFETSIILHAEARLNPIELNMKLRYSFFTIFKEGLRSIVQYSGGTQTLINIDLYKNKIMLKMQDTTARYTEDIHNIRAADEMKKHSEAINAEIDLQQDKNGIYIFVIFPYY